MKFDGRCAMSGFQFLRSFLFSCTIHDVVSLVCVAPSPALCPLGSTPFGSKCLELVVPEPKTFREADQECKDRHGKLLEIRSQTQNDFVTEMLNDQVQQRIKFKIKILPLSMIVLSFSRARKATPSGSAAWSTQWRGRTSWCGTILKSPCSLKISSRNPSLTQREQVSRQSSYSHGRTCYSQFSLLLQIW